MLIPTTEMADPTKRTRRSQLTLLVVAADSDRDRIERAFDDGTDLTVETAATLVDAWERLEAIDCLIVTPQAAEETDPHGADGDIVAAVDDHLEMVRTTAAELPVVVLADERTADLAAAVRSYDWTAVIERSEATGRLADRVHDLLERHRLATLSRRSLASIEFAGDAVAIVDTDDEIQFASRSFAMQFGFDHASLPGTPWRELFTDDAVDHLESAALPTITEGWRWTGTCTGRRNSGDTFAARVRLGGLEDGGLVFVVDESEQSELEE
ncbi:PAS domain-containing protein [Natrinema versiforme]|uniref:PAS domain S-box protein n=1 Tax=Natrinema versiforme TaxID=88724 RepID=A0A4V1FXC4_9EURY|nr:PAS domain-containing protein [Natrinema versiforme]QCS40925.1 PAS domain S-box protein [Natrinema versiforme]